MASTSELNREGSQLWVPTSEELTAHAAELATHTRHTNNFPPSRRCTEQFTGPAGPNPAMMIDFTAPDVRKQIEDSEKHDELVAQGRGFEDEEEYYEQQEQQKHQEQGDHHRPTEKPQTHRQVHNPYSVNQVYLKVEPGSNTPEHRQQSDYFPEIARQRQQILQQQQPPAFVAMNNAGILFMPPRPPNIESFDVFVKGGDEQDFADRVMTGMIYRWYSLCSVNVVTYRNWYQSVHGPEPASDNPLVGAPPPNPASFVDLSDWFFQAEAWWEANFSTRQPLRHNGPASRGAPHPSVAHSGPNQPTPSKRAPAVPQRGAGGGNAPAAQYGTSNNYTNNSSNPSYKNSGASGGHPPRAVDNSSGSSIGRN